MPTREEIEAELRRLEAEFKDPETRRREAARFNRLVRPELEAHRKILRLSHAARAAKRRPLRTS